MNFITVPELAMWLASGFDFTLIDARRAEKRAGEGDEIPAGEWFDPAQWLDWKDRVPESRPAIVYCAYGHEISQGLAAALRAMGLDARNLKGGIAAWRDAGRPVDALARSNP